MKRAGPIAVAAVVLVGVVVLFLFGSGAPAELGLKTRLVERVVATPGATTAGSDPSEAMAPTDDRALLDGLIASFDAAQEICGDGGITLDCDERGCALLLDPPEGRWGQVWHDLNHPRRWAEDRLYFYFGVPWATPCFEAFGEFSERVVTMGAEKLEDPRNGLRACYALIPRADERSATELREALEVSARRCDTRLGRSVFVSQLRRE